MGVTHAGCKPSSPSLWGKAWKLRAAVTALVARRGLSGQCSGGLALKRSLCPPHEPCWWQAQGRSPWWRTLALVHVPALGSQASAEIHL